ncbi:MAG: hypothetical protein ACIALR_08035 [Blastopirellula sp. JB062]
MKGFLKCAAIIAVTLVALAAIEPAQAQHCGGGGFGGAGFGPANFGAANFGPQTVFINGQPFALVNGQLVPLTNPAFAANGFIGAAATPAFFNPFAFGGGHNGRGFVQQRTVERRGLFGRPIRTETTTIRR